MSDTVAEHYDRLVGGTATCDAIGPEFSAVLGLFPAQPPTQPAERFLDIGCHNGRKTVLVAERIGARQVVGVEFLEPLISLARGRGVDARWADLNSDKPLDLATASFDCILCSEVIEHIYSPDFLLSEINRLLRPGGYCVITTPNLASWKNRIALLLGWQPFFSEVSTRVRVGNPRAPQGIPSGHIRLFTARALTELLAVYGLEVETRRGIALGASPAGVVSGASALVDRLLAGRWPSFADVVAVRARKP